MSEVTVLANEYLRLMTLNVPLTTKDNEMYNAIILASFFNTELEKAINQIDLEISLNAELQ